MSDVLDDEAVIRLRRHALEVAPPMVTDERRVLATARRRRALRRLGGTSLALACALLLATGVDDLLGADGSALDEASDGSPMALGPLGLACGDPVPVREDAEPDPDETVALELAHPLAPMPTDGRMAVGLVLVLTAAAPNTSDPRGQPAAEPLAVPTVAEGPQLLIARDGKIVALTPTFPVSSDALTVVESTDSLRVTGLGNQIDLVSCAEPTLPLPPGEYDVYGVQAFTQQTAGAVTSTTTAAGPWPVTVVQAGSALPPLPEATILETGPDCFADEVLDAAAGPPELEPSGPAVAAGVVPETFDAVAVVHCRWHVTGYQEVTLDGAVAEFVEALSAPSVATPPDVACNEVEEEVPQIYLVDAGDRAVRPAWPRLECGILNEDAVAAFGRLNERDVIQY